MWFGFVKKLDQEFICHASCIKYGDVQSGAIDLPLSPDCLSFLAEIA